MGSTQKRKNLLSVETNSFLLDTFSKRVCCAGKQSHKSCLHCKYGGNLPDVSSPLNSNIQGPVVQSLVSLTNSLRVISLTVLADSIHNILIFFAENM